MIEHRVVPFPSQDPDAVPDPDPAAEQEAIAGATPPADPHVADRLRAAARAVVLASRGAVLGTWRLLRRRVTPPAPALLQRILVLRTDRIGDMALTTAALQDLRAHFRHARITVLAQAAPLALLEHDPAVDRRVLLAGRRLPEELAGRFDLAIDFTSDEALWGSRLAAQSRATWRIGLARAGREAFFTLASPPARARRSIVELNRDLLAALGVPRSTTAPRLVVTDEERHRALARAAALGSAAPRVVVHPGAHYETQRWPAERYAEVIARLTERAGASCLVLTGPGEEPIARGIADRTPDALLAGPVTVREMMALVGTADLFLGNNSGPLHVASALGVPTLSVAGPTDLSRFAPAGTRDAVVRRAIVCSPCGRARCWHHTCLLSITADEVVARAARLLAGRPQERAA